MRAPGRRPILCVITDRRRAYAGSDVAGAFECLAMQARFAAEAGIDLLQVRENDLEGAALADLVGRLIEAVRGSDTKIIVNDRADVAITCGAAGVHLRESSPSPARVRSLAPDGFLIGASVHGVDRARERAGDSDYLIAGTVFSTPSKPGAIDLLGIAGLREIVASVGCPVLAIGGMTTGRASDVARAGAAGIAAIGLFLDAGQSGSCRAGRLADTAGLLRRAFM